MKSSFSVVRDDDSDGTNNSNSDEEQPEILDEKNKRKTRVFDQREMKLDNDIMSPKKRLPPKYNNNNSATTSKEFSLFSEMKPSLIKSKSLKSGKKLSISDSESDISENEESDTGKNVKVPINEYNPALYKDLDVEEDIKDLFQYIVRYMPQQLTLDYKFKPFIPDYLPAVGDIDAFIKIIPPDTTLCGQHFNIQEQQLGFAILDEPATIQSDSALLHLQLRASCLEVQGDNVDVVVKKVDNVDKNQKVVEKWIKDISDLHKTKSSTIIRYSETMPDIDDLMQEWPEEMENRLKEHGFPSPEENMTLIDYVELICDIFQIPTTKNKIHSLHLLFSLYAAIKDSQLYKPVVENSDEETKENQPDQLVLE